MKLNFFYKKAKQKKIRLHIVMISPYLSLFHPLAKRKMFGLPVFS